MTDTLRPVIEDPDGTLQDSVRTYARKHGLTMRRAWTELVEAGLDANDVSDSGGDTR